MKSMQHLYIYIHIDALNILLITIKSFILVLSVSLSNRLFSEQIFIFSFT